MNFHPNEVSRRGRTASIAVIVLFAALAGRFFSFQILQHAEFALLSDKNRLNEVPLPAPRGIIYDRHKLIVAENIPGYTVSVLTPNEVALREVLNRVGARVPMTKVQIEAAIKRRKQASNRPTLIFGDASFETVSILEEHRAEFPGLIIQSAPKRHYPDSSIVSAIVGYTGEVNEAELASDIGESYKPGQQIGKLGLELEYESVLRGSEGSRFVEVDAKQRVVRDAGVRAELRAVAGPDLQTNLDLDLQRAIAKVFGDSLDGAAVALDPKTGGVLALYSAPGYDPNRFIGGIDPGYFAELRTHPRRPMYNKAVQGHYAPGSTWKLATAVMALEKGIVRMDERMPQPCDGGFQFGNRRWRCWDRNGHGGVDLRGAIAHSCDVYFYQLGIRMSLANLIAGGRKMHFGERTGIDLPQETKSDFPPADSINAYYTRKFKANWVGAERAEALNLAIGQGSNAATVISMARFYTALATDGYMAKPHIVGDSVERIKIFDLPPEQMAQVREAMVSVTSAGGTAAGSAIKGVEFAGKTGTAQNPDDPKRDHAWFAGFAPANDPKIVVVVFLEFGLHGSRAGRIAKVIVEHYLHTRVTATQDTGD